MLTLRNPEYNHRTTTEENVVKERRLEGSANLLGGALLLVVLYPAEQGKPPVRTADNRGSEAIGARAGLRCSATLSVALFVGDPLGYRVSSRGWSS